MSARVRVHTSVFRVYINHMMTEDRYYDGIGTMDFIKRLLYAGTAIHGRVLILNALYQKI